MSTPNSMPRNRFGFYSDTETTPDPWEVEGARMQRILDQVRGVYEQVTEFAGADAYDITQLIVNRFDEGVRP